MKLKEIFFEGIMKAKTFLLAIVLLSNISFSQPLTESYFPMSIGNYWEYKTEDIFDFIFRKIEISGDTLMQNDIKYYIFNVTDTNAGGDITNSVFYARNDSLAQQIYYYTADNTCQKNEWVKFEFDLQDKTVWPICGNNSGYAGGLWGVDTTILDWGFYGINSPIKRFGNVEIQNSQIPPDTIWYPIFGGFTEINWLMKGFGVFRTGGHNLPTFLLNGCIINGVQYGTITSVNTDDQMDHLQINYKIDLRSFPNPFNPVTKIKYTVPNFTNRNLSAIQTKLTVYDILGNKVRTLVDGVQLPGEHEVEFNAAHLPSGVYLLTLNVENLSINKKIVLWKEAGRRTSKSTRPLFF